jgi:hypothetical protein
MAGGTEVVIMVDVEMPDMVWLLVMASGIEVVVIVAEWSVSPVRVGFDHAFSCILEAYL